MAERPQKIGKYEIRGTVGKGAMGVVYDAVDPFLGRPVAIKTLSISGSPHEAELRLRFLREARSVGMLQHPNIITVHELLFEEAGTAYLVMELLEGASLFSLLRRRRELSLGEKLSILDQIAAGLSEAHAHRIVHRDLKPSNVFVLKSGVVKVLDFGVAKMGEGELTKAGTVFGTIEYMAPEQVRGAKVTPRADIFSLGVVSYEIFTGRNPFRGDTLAASVFKIVSDMPEPLSGERFGLPAEIDAFVFRALAKTESERFESMAEFRTALLQAAEAARVALKPPVLSEQDVVISKNRGEEGGPSVEPRVSQWSHVAAQADLLGEMFQRGVASFQSGDHADCVEKMSQVLDEVPVHSMALHYLAVSEERLRRERLAEGARKELARLLTAMREAHRRGEPRIVIEQANALLAIDKESMEARWYRRNAEARLRAVSVGVANSSRTAGGRSHAGTLGREAGKSFGYVPPRQPPRRTPEIPVVGPVKESSQGKGVWFLVGSGVLFVGLVALWLSSLGGVKPTVSAQPPVLPGVRTSPFEGLDEDGTVVLHVPRPEATFVLRQVIPTSVVSGQSSTVGIFGQGFEDELVVTVENGTAAILRTEVKSPEHIEIELVAPQEGDSLVLVVTSPQGARATLSLKIDPE